MSNLCLSEKLCLNNIWHELKKCDLLYSPRPALWSQPVSCQRGYTALQLGLQPKHVCAVRGGRREEGEVLAVGPETQRDRGVEQP